MNMVERVARALAKADRIEICSDASYEFSSYGPKARAAIEAMREPTETMERHGQWAVETCTRDDPCETPAKHIWSDMITAALGEGK